MAFSSTIQSVASIAENLQISDLIEYYGGIHKIADQYESWGDRIHATINVDFIQDLYKIADGNDDPLYWYLNTRLGSGLGFWDDSSWECSDVLYREAIKDGRLI